MKHIVRRFTAALVSGALCLSLVGPSLAAEEADLSREESAALLAVTTGEYTRKDDRIVSGGLYTLIALPKEEAPTGDLTAAQLLTTGLEPLFFGTAKARKAGEVTFENVRLRSAQAVEYFVTGPGLPTPLREATGRFTSITGTVKTASPGDHSATVRLVDGETGYVYPDVARAIDSGAFSFSSISPSTYKFYITKPGYLPYTSTAVDFPDGPSMVSWDISENVGDVNGDRTRDNRDLAAILPYYGQTGLTAVPEGLTPDLNCDGAVNDGDLALVVGRDGVQVGQSEPAERPTLSVTDQPVSGNQSLHKLVFTLSGSTTLSAGAFTLAYYTDVIQPCTPSGGTANPGSGRPACLRLGDGVTLAGSTWTSDAPCSTLSLTLAAPAKGVSGDTVLAEFYYKPVSGTTDAMFTGVFQLPLARVLVGKQTVVDCLEGGFTYPGVTDPILKSLTIDQPSQQELTIPAAGQNTVLFLTAHGEDKNTPGLIHQNLSNVRWEVTDPQNPNLPVPGVSVMNGMLTITSLAAQGEFTVTAHRDNISSDPITITLKPQAPVISSLALYEGNKRCTFVSIKTDTAAQGSVTADLSQSPYSLVAYDQYGKPVSSATPTWTLSGAPSGVTVESGVITAPNRLPAGKHTFQLYIACGGAQATVTVEVTVEPALGSLSISGPQSANVPTEGSVTLTYTVTALDNLGNPMPAGWGTPALRVVNGSAAVVADHNVKGHTVTVAPQAETGDYELVAEYGDGEKKITSPVFTLSLLNPSDVASHAALYENDVEVKSAALTAPMGAGLTRTFSAKLLNYLNQPIDSQPAFTWTVTGGQPGVTVDGEGTLTVSKDLAVGSYQLTLSAKDETTQLSASILLSLTVTPVLGSLTVAGPEEGALTIPTGADLSYTFALVGALDTQGKPMKAPDDLVWSVAPETAGGSLTGVSIDAKTGALTVGSDAAPGRVVVTASSGKVSGSVTVTLQSQTAGQSSYILKLYRGGEAISGLQDSVAVKAGDGAILTYTVQVIDQRDGRPVPVEEGDILWLNSAQAATADHPDAAQTLAVSAAAAPGVYDAIITAVYRGHQSVSVLAQVVVYPKLKEVRDAQGELCYQLRMEWEGSMPIPDKGESPTYRGKVFAQTVDGEWVPLSQLPEGYSLTVDTRLPGVYPRYDMSTHTLLVTVDSSVTPSYAQGADKSRQTLGLTLSYFPGETREMSEVELPLEISDRIPTSIWLYRGQGTGSSFAFSTAEADEILAAPGTLANCYAIQILDQYGQSMVGKKVEWSLEGDHPGITLEEPSYADQYPNYTGLVRLNISKDAAVKDYSLTLKAVVEGYTRTLPITIKLSAAATVGAVNVGGKGQVYIPIRYLYPNDPDTLSNKTISAAYTAALVSDQGFEVDVAGREITWEVTKADGSPLTRSDGVTWTQSGNSLTLTVDRLARPTGGADGTNDPRLILTATDALSGVEGACRVELVRQESYPLVLTLHNEDGERVTSDSLKVPTSHGTVIFTYTPRLFDQYGERLNANNYDIVWSSTSLPSGVSFQNGELNISSSAKRSGSFTLSAKLNGNRYPLETKVKFTLTVGSGGGGTITPGGNGGGPGGGPGGGQTSPTPPASETPSVTPSVTPSTSPTPSSTPSPSWTPSEVPSAQKVYPTVSQSGTAASVTLTPEQEQALTGATTPGAVTIVPTGGVNVTVINVSISNTTVNIIANQDRPLKVETTMGTVMVPAQTLKELGGQGGSNVTVEVSRTGHTFTVDFRAGGQSVPAAGTVILNGVDPTISGTGNVAARVDGGVRTILPKALVEGNRVIAELPGPAQVEILTRGKSFSDTQNHWAKNAITFVTARELFLGTSGSAFSPGGDMTRGMVVTVLHRLESKPDVIGFIPYDDVSAQTWYSDAVTWADAHGIVRGSGGHFNPNTAVTREQLATIFCRYAASLGKDTSARGSLARFPDGNKTSSWAFGEMQWAVSVGLISGKGDGTLDPQGTASRAEVATMLERLVRIIAPSV